MKIFATIALTLLHITVSVGQPVPSAHTLVLVTEATLSMPINQIELTVDLYTESPESVQAAIQLNQQLENELWRLIQLSSIPKEQVSILPLTVNTTTAVNKSNEEHKLFYVNHYAVIKLTNIDSCKRLQVSLLENNFERINMTFTNTDSAHYQEALIEQCIQRATQQANATARAAKRKIGRIVAVSPPTHDELFVFNYKPDDMLLVSGNRRIERKSQRSEIPANISLHHFLKVTFELL